MVKANAYGHGLEPLLAVFSDEADELGVATLEEGIQIRAHLPVDFPVFVMSGEKDWGDPDALDALRQARLLPAVSSLGELRLMLDRIGSQSPLAVELKLDTGMARLGIQPRELGELISLLESSEKIQVKGVLTHYASADEEDLDPTWHQERHFTSMVSRLSEHLVSDIVAHSCNSGALLQRGLGQQELGERTSVVRPGVMLYGAAPSRYLQDSPIAKRLEPVGTWSTRVMERREVEPGGAVGYGGTWEVEGPGNAQVAVLAVGYADGFRRSLGNRGRVLIRGGSFPVIGRVSMDLVTVLVNDRIQVGDEAVLLGPQAGELGRDEIPVWEWARHCGTIPYEIWTGLGSRVKRIVAPE